MEQTTISKRWLWKMLVMLVLLVGFGAYGLLDAVVRYPRRGREYSSYVLRSYLTQLRNEGLLTYSTAAVTDPKAELHRLNHLPSPSTSEQARFAWLTSLERVGDLDEARLVDAAGQPKDVIEELRTLDARWSTSSKGAPIPLGRFDIPVQWVFVAIGALGSLWVLSRVLPTISKKYRWDPVTKTLTLPSGDRITPGDIAEFDKRDWKKFFIYVLIKPDHATLGGKELKIDLYTHDKLEGWVLEMERIAFPDRATESAGQGVPTTGSAT